MTVYILIYKKNTESIFAAIDKPVKKKTQKHWTHFSSKRKGLKLSHVYAEHNTQKWVESEADGLSSTRAPGEFMFIKKLAGN